jgi:autotransporter-associated beta strand protein
MKPAPSFLRRPFVPSLVAVTLVLTCVAGAANLTWDSGNTANGPVIDPAGGTWDTTATVWNDGAANVAWTQTSATVPLNAAIFAGADGVHPIIIGTALATSGMTFGNSGYTLSAPAAQTITTTSNIVVASGMSATIGSNVTVTASTGSPIFGAPAGGGTGTLDIAAGATVQSTVQGNTASVLTGNGSEINVSGTLKSTNSATSGTNAIFRISTNALDNVTLNVNSGGLFQFGGRRLDISQAAGSSATINVDGGTLNSVLTSGGNGAILLGFANNSTTGFNISNDGSVTSGGDFLVGVSASSTASLSVSGGTLAVPTTLVVGDSSGNATATLSDTGVIRLGSAGLGLVLNRTGATAAGIFNLDGGTLVTPKLSQTQAGAIGTFNFNGGTLKANLSNANYMTGVTTANVHDNGAIIDTDGFDIVIGQALTHSAIDGAAAIDGGLTKNGVGELTLSSSGNTYTGPTIINGGTLSLANVGLSDQSGITVGASGSLKVKGTDPVTIAGPLISHGKVDLTGTAGSANTLTVDGTVSLNNASLHYDLFSGGADRVTATGAAVNTGTTTVNLSLASGETVTSGTRTLLSAAGGLDLSEFVIGTKPPGFSTYTLSTPTANALVLNVLAGNPTPSTAYWTGAASGTGSPADATNLWGYGSALAVAKSNWSTNAAGTNDPLQIPGSGTNVIFSAANATGTAGVLNTKLEGGYSVQGVTFNVPTATAITSVSVDTNGFPLTIGGGGLTLAANSNSNGTIGGTGSIVIGNDQSWSNNSNTRVLAISAAASALSDPAILTLNGSGSGGLSIGSVGDGSGKLNLISFQAGLTTLSGSQTYTGTTEIFSGRMRLDNLASFPSQIILANAVADALTFHQDSSSLILPDISISGEGGIVKTGPGMLTLTHGLSSYSGGTAVNGGTLRVNSSTGQGTADGDTCTVGLMTPQNLVAVNNGGTLSINGTASFGNSLLLPQYSPSITINPGGVLNGNGFVAFLPNLTLNGGAISVGAGNTTGGFNTNLGLVGTVTVEGTVPSVISTPVEGANSRVSLGAGIPENNGVTFSVADVTGNADTDFTISSILRNAGTTAIPQVSPLTKTGPGTMLLSATNLYTGTTTVSGGELILGTASLADSAEVVIDATATLNLAHGALDTVLALTIGGVQMSPGTYGAAGIPNPRITGTGSLVVTTGPASGYDTWALVIPDPADRDRTDDPDGDGFTNLSEYLFGTSPVAGNGALLLQTPSGPNLILRWSQRNSETFLLQESTTLAENPWPASTVPVSDSNDQTGLYSADYTRKEAIVPINSNRKFVRVMGEE